MKRKNILLAAILTILSISSSTAKSMREMWLAMPDSIVSTLNKNQRLELVELLDMKVKAEVTNQLQGTSSLDSLSADYLKVTVSKCSTVEMKLLPGNDSLLCLIHTFMAPEKESEIKVYTRDWHMTDIEVNTDNMQLTAKPDTMEQQQYDKLIKLIDPRMVNASFAPNSADICLALSLPLLGNDDKKEVASILLQRKLKWNGAKFNEY